MNELVKEFYDQNPYPAPLILGKRLLPDNLFEDCCKKVHKPIPESPRILIVGCGTSLPELIAEKYPKAQIICAVDISSKTIEIAKKQCKSKRVHFVKGDIADSNFVNLLPEETFDWIHCTGVLHHLNKPEDGIKNLSKILSKEGLIKFQLYSKGARTWIEWARSLLLQKKAKNILDVKDILTALTKHHPFHFTLATYPESLSLKGVRDGFLHPVVVTHYAKEWSKLCKQNNLSISYWDNHSCSEEIYDIFPEKHHKALKNQPIENKITLLEKLWEWRSDFRGVITKSEDSSETHQASCLNTDYIIDPITNFSYPRYYLWQETKSGLKDLEINFNADDLKKIIDNLSMREWLTGIQSLRLRFKWSSWSDRSRKYSSSGFLFQKKLDFLIENYINDEDKQIYIPSPDTWQWIQFEQGFFAWQWY